MNHDFDGVEWANNHHHLSDAIAMLVSRLAYGFRRLRRHSRQEARARRMANQGAPGSG